MVNQAQIDSQKAVIVALNAERIAIDNRIPVLVAGISTATDTGNANVARYNDWKTSYPGCSPHSVTSKGCSANTIQALTESFDAFTVANKTRDTLNAELAIKKARLLVITGKDAGSLYQANAILDDMILQFSNESKTAAYNSMTPEQKLTAAKAEADAQIAATKAASLEKQKNILYGAGIALVFIVVLIVVWKVILKK